MRPDDLQRTPNLLINEKSPYLLQHAFNPVDWYPWGEEAFAAAVKMNKPLFLSIGYSTCHWCHVMEKESFENIDIAAYLNKNFISIKVDREERPDIDQIYMTATQAIAGGGGWPMSVFLFPDKKPFYAGTYFPPEPRHNHPGFPELLRSIMRAWKENNTGLQESASKITAYLVSSSKHPASESLQPSWLDSGYRDLYQTYDSSYHGFGTGNKFPRPSCLDFLQLYSLHSKNANSFQMLRNTLIAMARGGMYDHIGGGFHRYAVDRQWRIPHFEKMLYDQAQLVTTFLHMYQQTGENIFADTARETIDYVLRDLHHPAGGFYSAEDADSVNPYDENEHGEGAFYLWKESEIREVLDQDEADVFVSCYGVRPSGNALHDPAAEFTGRNILYLAKPFSQAAPSSEDAHRAMVLNRAKAKLLHRRNSRKRPHLDDKIITAWNGLMIGALAKASRILGNEEYLKEGTRAADFLLSNLYADGKLKRRWRDKEARFEGVLEDHAFLIYGLLELYQACHMPRYLQAALSLSEDQLEIFSDQNGGFFNNSESGKILTRIKESYDGAEPSGNSVAALNFIRLGRLAHRQEWVEIGENTIKSFGTMLDKHPSAMPLMLSALQLAMEPAKQLIVEGDKNSQDTLALLRKGNEVFNPWLTILLADGAENEKMLSSFNALANSTINKEQQATAYFCKNYSCELPTRDPEELEKQLNQ